MVLGSSFVFNCPVGSPDDWYLIVDSSSSNFYIDFLYIRKSLFLKLTDWIEAFLNLSCLEISLSLTTFLL
jgi:hypothetical protein